MNERFEKKELAKTIKELDRLEANLCNLGFDGSHRRLKQLVYFIDQTSIVKKHIQSGTTKKYDFEKKVKNRQVGDRLNVPVDRNGEIAYIYQLLQYLTACEINGYEEVLINYFDGNNLFECFDRFGVEIVEIFVEYLKQYLQELIEDKMNVKK